MISVCMATYNGEKYIRDQLDSIICNLNEKEDEIIISDDGSCDRTLDIINEYVNCYPGMIKIVEGPHKGVVKNFEHAISIAQGEYIFLSDQDDIWENNKVTKVMNCFDKKIVA